MPLTCSPCTSTRTRRPPAASMANRNGKAEAWHILWAAEGATILAGVRAEMTHQDLFDAFKDRDYDRAMPRLPIRTGETVYIPAGIIHSFGPDTLIFEVQQTSDLGANVMPNDLYNNPYPEETWEVNIRNTLSELRTHYPAPTPPRPATRGERQPTRGRCRRAPLCPRALDPERSTYGARSL